MLKEKKAVLFLGTHRTGTTALSGFFKQCFPEIESHHQFNSGRLINVLSNMYLGKKINKTQMQWFVGKLVTSRILKAGSNLYLETSGYNNLAAQFIEGKDIKLKVVHMIRDPRNFVTSYINWAQTQWKSKIAHTLIPFWNPSGYLVGDYSKKEWKSMDLFQRNCWYWNYKNTNLRDWYENNQTNYLSIRFEDLIGPSSRLKTLQKILEFIDVPYVAGCEDYFNKKQNIAAKQVFPNWTDWGSKQCQFLQDVCAALIDEYQYCREPEWKEKLENIP